MAKKDSFLTRLGTTLKNTSLYKFSQKGFGKPNGAETPENALPENNQDLEHSAEELMIEQQAENPEQTNEAEPKKPAEPEVYPDELELEHDHPLLALWSMHLDSGLNMPRPRLRMQNNPNKPEAIKEEQVGRELLRLGSALSAAANKRLKSAVPKNEEDPIPDLDAQTLVFLTNGQMSAWLLIFPPVGQGKKIDLEMLKNALEEKHVTYGVDTDLLCDIPEQPNPYFHLYLVAQGQPPERGQDGHVEELFPRVIKHEFTVDEFDRVDYMSLNFIRNVSKGDTICNIFPPTLGIPGRTVLDRELTAVDGKKANVPMGRNTEISEDGTKLVASMTGHVEFSGRGFQVKPVLDIEGNVDYSTGNINFLGDVHIHGDVCSGFTVRAVGNITIDGVVESCSIEAGGDLIMVKGVMGNNQAIIRSQRSIFTKYLESTSVCARGDLQADYIVNCEIYCDGVVQVRTGKGIIMGGNINAAKEVSASIVGAKSEILTNITLGGSPCENFERGLLEHELVELEKELDKTDRQPNSPAKLSAMSKLRMKIVVSKSKLAQLDKDREKLQEENKKEQSKGKLVCGVAYPGTQINIKGVSMRLTNETHMCNARLIANEICLM